MDSAESNSPLEIRHAAPGEGEVIASVLRKAFAEYEPLYTAEAFAATCPSLDQILSRWEEGPVWVAIQDQSILGTLSAVPRGRLLYLRSMGVLPEARGRGLGRQLLRHVECFAREQGFQGLQLHTLPFLARAIALYEHSGFKPSPQRPDHLLGIPLVNMVKQLGT